MCIGVNKLDKTLSLVVSTEELNLLMSRAKLGTNKELFNAAFTTLQWVLDQLEAKRQVGSYNPINDSFKEVEFDFLHLT